MPREICSIVSWSLKLGASELISQTAKIQVYMHWAWNE